MSKNPMKEAPPEGCIWPDRCAKQTGWWPDECAACFASPAAGRLLMSREAENIIGLIEAQPGCRIDPHARDYVGRLFDRFAARREAEALLRKIERLLVEDTNAEGDPCCGWGPLLAEVRAVLAGGGGDAPRTISIDFEGIDAANAAFELIDETFGEWLSKNGGTLSISSPQTGGGDAGERAREMFTDPKDIASAFVAIIAGQQRELVAKSDRDYIATYLASIIEIHMDRSHREGAEAMREACKQRMLDMCRGLGYHPRSTMTEMVGEIIDALPIPGKTDAS